MSKVHQRIYESDYWITSNGDLVSYTQLDEEHAKNIFHMLKKFKIDVPNKLLDRIEYFNRKKSELKQLF